MIHKAKRQWHAQPSTHIVAGWEVVEPHADIQYVIAQGLSEADAKLIASLSPKLEPREETEPAVNTSVHVERCPTNYQTRTVTLRCRRPAGHDGDHDFGGNATNERR